MNTGRYRYRGSGLADAPVDRNPGAAGRLPRPVGPETPRERMAAAVWTAGWEAVRRVPEPVAFWLADLVGRLAHRGAGGRRRLVRANLARVVPAHDLDAAVAAAFRSYARYWVEAFRAADLDVDDLDRRTTTGGFAHLDGVLAQGDGVIVLLAHHGSWDVAARWAESHGYHLAVVAEVVRPRRVFERFVRLREVIGLEVVPLRRGAELTSRLATVLRANHLVGLLTDRDLSGDAPQVAFFGEPCPIPLGAALLAKRQHVPIVPITMLQRPGRRWHLQVLPAIDPSGLTLDEVHRAVAAALEDLVRLEPAQWHAFQPIWPTAVTQGGDADAASGAA